MDISKEGRKMLKVNVRDAWGRLGALLDRVERGEEIIITLRGKL
jgi:prevent-host-death family protein